jgi:enoyl-CoA hydratase
MTNDDVVVGRDGTAGRITLNRPKALNALTYPMIGAVAGALAQWAHDPAVTLVILDGVGERGLCAGGDVIALYDSRASGPDFARRFWADEYRLNAQIARFPKPFVALMDGIVMGGGIGLSAHASHRVVTERSRLAMPETSIGLIPDVGGTWLLAHAPRNCGVYLGLTGERMSAADARFAGFADTLVPTAELPALIKALSMAQAGDVGRLIAQFSQHASPGSLQEVSRKIELAFGGATIEAILAELVRLDDDWSRKTAALLAAKSPLALKATLAAVHLARTLPSLEAALDMEFRLVTRLFENGEFIEGVRALLVDKDKAPKWRLATLDAVTIAHVSEMLSPLPQGLELALSEQKSNAK